MIADHDPSDGLPPDYADHLEPAPTLRRARRRRRPSRVLRGALGLAAIVVTLAVVVAGVGFAYLGRSAISLEVLQPSIAASLQSRLKPGYAVALGPTSIMRGPHGLGIGFSGLAIRDPQGRTVVNAPGGRIGLDAFALLELAIKVRSLELDGLALALRVGADGELSLAAGEGEATPIPLGPPPSGGGDVRPGALVAGIAEAMAGADQPLDHVAIIDGRLSVQTAGRGAPTVYDGLRLALDRSRTGVAASLVAHGPSGEWKIEAHAETGATRRLSFEARELAVDDFLRLQPNPPAVSFDSPISLQFVAEATPAGALQKFDGAFSLGAGKLDLHDPDGSPPIAIDEATGQIALDGEGRFRLDKVELLAGPSHARLSGLVTPPGAAGANWRLQLHSGDILLTGTMPNAPPAKFDDVNFDAHFDKAAQTFQTDRISLRGPHLAADLGAQLRLTPEGPALKLDLSGAGSLMQALQVWPSFINPDARKWCEESVRGGELVSGSLKIDWSAAAFADVLAKRAPPAESVNGHFSLRETSAVLLPGLPTTTGIDAVGDITGRYFHVAAGHGQMELPSGRKLTGTDLSFTVPDTAPNPRMPAEGGGHVAAGADALAELLSQDALKRYVGVTLDPAAMKGQFQGDLKLDLTLGKGIQPEEQKFRVAASLAALSIDKFLGNSKLEGGALDVVFDRVGLKMTGSGQVFGAPAKLDVVKAGQDIGTLTVTASLDEAARAKMGFNGGPRVRGPIALKLKAPLDKSGADVEADLTKATLDGLGGPGWKAAGKSGKATFQVKVAPEGVQVNNIVVDAGTVSARGSALFSSDGPLKSLKLTSLKMSAADDLRLDLDGGDRAKITIRGAALDARGFVKSLSGGGDADRDPHDLDLDVKVGAAIGNNNEKISAFELSAARRNGAFTALDARGRIGQSGFSARSGEGGVITVKSDDAGALARFLDVYGKLEGGAIEMTVKASGDSARGTATIKRFAIRDEPSLKQLEQAAPPRQNLARGSNQTTGGDASPPVKFDKMTANFTRSGGKLDVRDGVISNASFGLTTAGFIDFAKDKVDFSGVFVPLYGVNNAFGSIPVLGTLLTGGQNEGVFAINYRITGSASSPSLNINPLSGMTPGILRKMFGAIDGTAAPAQTPDSPANAFAPTLPNR